jgi:hypothetical protein
MVNFMLIGFFAWALARWVGRPFLSFSVIILLVGANYLWMRYRDWVSALMILYALGFFMALGKIIHERFWLGLLLMPLSPSLIWFSYKAHRLTLQKQR